MVELGSGDPAKANTARVKFTVRTAGVYIINILIGECTLSSVLLRLYDALNFYTKIAFEK